MYAGLLMLVYSDEGCGEIYMERGSGSGKCGVKLAQR
jgi:hypothetical protein